MSGGCDGRFQVMKHPRATAWGAGLMGVAGLFRSGARAIPARPSRSYRSSPSPMCRSRSRCLQSDCLAVSRSSESRGRQRLSSGAQCWEEWPGSSSGRGDRAGEREEREIGDGCAVGGARASGRGRERDLSWSRPTAHQTTTHNPRCEAKRDSRRDEGETKAEGGQVPVRNRGEGFLRLIKLPGEQGPRGTGAVHLIEDGRSRRVHGESVAQGGGRNEGDSDRLATISAAPGEKTC